MPTLLVPVDTQMSQTEPRGGDDSAVAVRHAFLVPRLLVPAGAHLSQTEPTAEWRLRRCSSARSSCA